MNKIRTEKEPPKAISDYGWRYHYLGIPTSKPHTNEKYLAENEMYVSGFEISEFGIEWMRFEDNSPISELIQSVPHIAFEVDDLDKAIKRKKMIGKITAPSPGKRAAMIIENGAPIELLEFSH